MNTITFKADNDLIKAMEKAMKPLYSTKTEFIREAIRKLVNDIETENSIRELMKLKGSVKTKTTMAELRATRIKVGNEILKEYERRHNLKD